MFPTDPLTRSWVLALVMMAGVIIAIPLLRLGAALCIHGYAALTGRRHLHALARRVTPRIAHLMGSLIIGTASIASPAMAQGDTPRAAVAIDLDRGSTVPDAHSIDLDLDRGSAAQPEPPAADVGRAPVPATSTPNEQDEAAVIYVVRAGDSLWSIAQDQLATPTDASTTEAWKAIWRANRTVIGEHPEHIVPGQVLQLGDLA